MWNAWGIREVHREFWWGSLEAKKPLEIRRRRWKDNIKMNLQEK